LTNVSLEIQLQDESGGRIESIIDPKNLLPDLLPPEGKSEAYPMLAGIDLYGDTIFNRLQIPPFLVRVGGRYFKHTNGGRPEVGVGNREVSSSMFR
jgi:hypothetical protein